MSAFADTLTADTLPADAFQSLARRAEEAAVSTDLSRLARALLSGISVRGLPDPVRVFSCGQLVDWSGGIPAWRLGQLAKRQIAQLRSLLPQFNITYDRGAFLIRRADQAAGVPRG